MKLSSKKHGRINVFYYKNPETFHTYTLNSHTIAEHLKWMFKHITDHSSFKKSDLRLVADKDGVRMINRKTGGRMYFLKPGNIFAWYEDKVLDMSTMHEDYEYNQ
jgi:hypothetical protein